MADFQKLKIEEIAKVVGGATPSTKIEKYWDGNIPWITPKDLSIQNSRFISKGERNITKEGLDSCSSTIMPKNSILFSSRAPIGYVAITLNPLCTNQGFKSLVADEAKTNYMFLYYLLLNNKEEIEGLGSGTTFKEVSGTVLRNYKVEIPSLKEQKAIADVLSCLDDKIELSNRINKNLEAQAQVIFKRWFVDFDFPDKDGNPYRSSGGEMVNSELGEIPKGWEVVSFKSLCKTTIGGDWGKEISQDNYDEEVICIRGADIPEIADGKMGKAPHRFIIKKNLLFKQLKPGNIIVEISGGSPTQSTGRSALIIDDFIQAVELPLICTNFCRAIEIKDSVYVPLFCMQFQKRYNDDIFFTYENGTTGIKNLDINSLLEQELIILSHKRLIEEYNNLFYKVKKQIISNQKQNQKLAELRNYLLPKLMSGEIRIGNQGGVIEKYNSQA